MQTIMKNIIRIVSTMLLAAAAALPVTAQQIMDGEAEIRDLDVNDDGKTVTVNMTLDVTTLEVGGDETLILTPVIEGNGHRVELPAIEIMGRRAYIHFLRRDEQTISENAAYADRTARRSQRLAGEQLIPYSATVASEKWMRDAEIGIREESCGCDDTPLALGTSPLAVILHTPYEPQYLLAFVEPDPEPVKTREESLSAYVNFKVDKHDILTDYKNNASELASIVESIERVDDDSDLTITSITIDGWASPEAPEAYNLALSERRAASLADYMAANTDVDRAKITATGRGEDWINLRKRVVETPKLLDQDKVLAIIDDQTMSLDEKDAALKRLIPPTIYQRLMNEMYPSLRRNDYRIIYNIRNFDVQEARALLDSDPKKLSLGEMYRVAGLYEKGSAEYNHVLEVAARTYPTQVAAAVNAAARLIEAGDYDSALSMLEKAPNDARVLNARGLAYARGGDADSARRTWSEAVKLGSAEAKHNIAELEKSLE